MVLGAEKIAFSHLTVADGLSQGAVNAIFQDSSGKMWFGTECGLNCYDGQRINVFCNDPSQPGSLPRNNVRRLHEGPDGHVWVACGNSLARFESSRNCFSAYEMPKEAGDIYDFLFLDSRHVVIGCRYQVVGLDVEGGGFDDTIVPQALKSSRVSEFYCHGSDVIMSTRNVIRHELLKWSLANGSVRQFDYNLSGKPPGPMVGRGDTLWVGTNKAGLLCINIPTMEGSFITAEDGLASNIVRALSFDSEGRLWVGTFGGVSILKDGKIVSECLPDYDDDASISHTAIKSLCLDNQGGMWIGTHYFGVDYHHPMRGEFGNASDLLGDSRVSKLMISSIREASDGSLWVASVDAGIFHYSSDGHLLRHYSVTEGQGALSKDIKDILVDDKRGLVYICAHSGNFTSMNIHTGEVKAYYHRPLDSYSMIRVDDDHLLVGTMNGLFSFDMNSRELSHLGFHYRIKVMTMDSEGNVWVGGDPGVVVLGPDFRPIDIPVLSGIDFVHCLHSSSELVWIGTDKGLYCFDSESQSLKSYTVKDGLSNNIVQSIEEDDNGILWVGTDNGLSRLDMSASALRSFFLNDGLPCQQFNIGASLRLSNGNMVFGSLKGLMSFNPASVSMNPFSPQPEIHVRTVSGEPMIADGNRLVLSSGNNSFSVNFSVPNYLDGGHSLFLFRTNLSDNEWHEYRGAVDLHFSNVRHGHYRMELRSANSNMLWCPDTTVLTLRIRPRWYQTNAFIVASVLLVFLALFLVLKAIIEHNEIRRRLEDEQKDKRHEEDIHQMKIRFFINMLHELKTPLTLLVAPLQEMFMNTDSKWMRKQITYVKDNAERLSRIVSQMMDYRRAELGIFKLRAYRQGVDDLLHEIMKPYESFARRKGLEFHLNSTLNGMECILDGQYLEIILNNLLSNAFKYTDSGRVDVNASIKGGNLIIEVADTGSGIPKEMQENIFDRFYQGDSDHFGSGVGLSIVNLMVHNHHGSISISSEEGAGSSFMVCIPQDASLYSEGEIQEGTPPGLSANALVNLDFHYADEGAEPRVPELSRGSVLVVEDDPAIRRYLNEGLSGYFDVLVASNGEEGFSILSHNDVDVILTDLVMPVMDGLKFCALVKRNVNTCHIPVIIVSAKNSMEDQLTTFQSGADDFISKPFSMTSLVAKVRNTIETRHSLLDRHSRKDAPAAVPMNNIDREFIEKATAIVKENLSNNDFSTVDLASAMCVSRSSLHIKLKAICGESALDFIRKIRFAEACRLLEEGEKQITEISELTGFGSLSYFSTAFKNYVGCLPSEYQAHK